LKKEDVVAYWLKSSKQDFESAEILYQNKKYHHALFFCHLIYFLRKRGNGVK